MDDNLGNVVRDLDEPIKIGKDVIGDVDIVLDKMNIQVKNSISNSKDILSKADYKQTIEQGKKFIVYVQGKISDRAKKALEAQGVIVTQTKEQLKTAVQQYK